MKLTQLRPGRAEIKRVVSFVAARYAPQRVRRAIYLDSLWTSALAQAGLSSTVEDASIHYTELSRPHDHEVAVVLARRATDLADIRRVSEGRKVERNFAIGPSDLNPPSRRADVEWLAARLDVSLKSEDEAFYLAQDMKAGKL